jgi:hypothetical protein
MYLARLPQRCHAGFVLLAVLALVMAGCGGSDGDSNKAPTLSFTAPPADVDVQAGAQVPITYADDDAENDPAVTTLYADLDGNLGTAGDQILLDANRPHSSGADQSVMWNTTGVAEGSWWIIAVTNDGQNGDVVTTCPAQVITHSRWPDDHTNIVLLDRLGNAIPVGSTEPYSPRQTCGACHDVDQISNAYHFQQGRTDVNGNIIMQDDYFGDNRPWLKSPGMYGKW